MNKNPPEGIEIEKPTRSPRERYLMPNFIRNALVAHGLTSAYDARLPYQRHDCIGWFTRAKLPVTQQKRRACCD